MALGKNLNKWAVLVAIETGSYGSGTPALAPATDGVLAYQQPKVDEAWQFDGQREGMAGSGEQTLAPVAPSARAYQFDLVHYFKGPLAAYSATVRSTIDKVLRGFGLGVTTVLTGGAEKHTYAPIAGAFEAIVAEVYTRGQKYNLKGGVVTKVVIEMDGLGVPKWTFSVLGIGDTTPTDVAVPGTLAYPYGAVKNPKATGITLTLTSGGQTFSGTPKKVTITLERTATERLSMSAANGVHAGWELGPVTATADVTIEATALVVGSPYMSTTAFDPHRAYENQVDMVLAIAVGSVQYNRFKVNGPNVHMRAAAAVDDEGAIPLWTLPLAFNASVDGALDSFNIVTD